MKKENMKGFAYQGWKLRLPDKFWPVTLDDFFENPDEIRELGLRMIKSDEVTKSSDEAGAWPGYRSDLLWKTEEGLSQRIIEKALSCYFNLDMEKIFWNDLEINFNLIPKLDEDKNNAKNKGWIHRDSVGPQEYALPKWDIPAIEEVALPTDLAGLIYLTPDIERNTGTSLFNVKKDKTLEDWEETIVLRREVFCGHPVNDEEIETGWKKHRSCFIEKVRFENIYNRLIMYDTKEWHAANSYYTAKDNRLTLAFFISGISAKKMPLERVKEIKIC